MNIFYLILTQPLANGLIIFYKILFSNLGLAIIGFSIFLKFILNPLTKPYMDSMQKMKDVAPLLEKIKIKHKGDKMKIAQAQADLYKEKGINPGAGCLPYILQIVVLIAFFNVFSSTLSKGGNVTENFNKLLYEPVKLSNGQQVNEKFLYLNLTKPDVIKIADKVSLPGPILILAALVQFLSTKAMTVQTSMAEKLAKKTESKEDDAQVMMQKTMSYTFPLFTLFVGMQFASGLALYWLIFSITQLIQQVGWKKMGLLLGIGLKK